MDCKDFWTAFAAIGTTAGAIVSSAVFVLTYIQYRLSKETKLKIKIKTVNNLFEENTTDSDKFLVFDFYNKGLINLSVKRIYVKLFGDIYDLTKIIESKVILNDCRTKLPVEVTNSLSVSVAITYSSLYDLINYVEELNDKKIKYLKFIIQEGTGKEYIKKIGINRL